MIDITRDIIQFRDDRDWAHYHSPENLAKSIAIEAAELLECFQWGPEWKSRRDVEDEIADVAIYLLTLCHEMGVDLDDVIRRKMVKNAAKYPLEAQ